MSIAKLGAGIEETAPDAIAEAIKAAFEARLIAFDCHRDDFLSMLQKVHERGPKAKSFDKNNAWRQSTGKRAGAGAGPFAQFVKKFLEALGRKGIGQQSIIKAIKTTKKREEKNLATSRWGQSRSSGLREAFLRYGGQIPPASQ